MLPEGYHVLEELTSRGSIAAWRARDPAGREVFAKELIFEHVDSWKAIELFEREVQTLRRLEHELVPRVTDSWTDAAGSGVTVGLAREWVAGVPLSTRIGETPEPQDEAFVRAVLAGVAPTLAYLHGLRPPVVHRDLTPDHIVEREDGKFVLVGFGGLQAALPRTRGGSTFVGTSGYIPPEQMMGSASPASDIYALGATCIALLSGFDVADLATKDMRIQFEEHVTASPALVELLRAMTHPRAEKRPPDGAALCRRLADLDTQLTVVQRRLLDHPAPAGLKVRTRGETLTISARGRFRRAGTLQISAGCGTLVFASMAAFFVIFLGAGLFTDAAVMLIYPLAAMAVIITTLGAASLLPDQIVIGPRGIRRRFQSYRYADLLEVSVRERRSEAHVVELEHRDGAVLGMTHLTRDEADWLVERIQDRMRRD